MASDVDILFATDKGFLAPTRVAAYSVLKHRPADSRTIFHVVTKGLERDEVEAAFKFDVAARAVVRHYSSEHMALDAGPQYDAVITSPSYFRLSLDQFIDVGRVIYLDGDLLCLGDIGALYGEDLGDKALGVVRDLFAVKTELIKNNTIQTPAVRREEYWEPMYDNLRRVAGGRPLRDLFNSGVLLVDVARYRDRGLAEAARQYAKQDGLMIGDQDALNLATLGDVKYISSAWNSSRGNLEADDRWPSEDIEYFRDGKADPKIVHFVGPQKPWKNYPRDYRQKAFVYDVKYSEYLLESGVSIPGASPVRQSEIDLFNAFSPFGYNQAHVAEFWERSDGPRDSVTAFANQYGSERGTKAGRAHRYTQLYDQLFFHLKDKYIRVIDFSGDEAAVKMWLHYFPHGTVLSADAGRLSIDDDRYLSLGAGQDLANVFPEDLKADIIIDAGENSSVRRQNRLKRFFPGLRAGGFYIFEDLNREVASAEESVRGALTADLLKYIFEKGRPLDDGVIDEAFARMLLEEVAAYSLFPWMGGGDWAPSKLCVLRKKA